MSEIDGQSKGGIFVTRGLTLTIPKGKILLALTPDGGVESSITMHVLQDVCPYWLEIAYQHLLDAEKHYQKVKEANQSGAKTLLGTALESEFKSGMQAIMAAVIAMDAFYATVKELIVLPKELSQAWRKNKTARHTQVAEVLKRAFNMSADHHKNVSDVLKQIFQFRDLAVHPPAEAREAILHPDLKVGVERRFISFGYKNVKTAVGIVLSIIAQAIERPNNNFPKLLNYCSSSTALVAPVLSSWETQYGTLFKRPPDTTPEG